MDSANPSYHPTARCHLIPHNCNSPILSIPTSHRSVDAFRRRHDGLIGELLALTRLESDDDDTANDTVAEVSLQEDATDAVIRVCDHGPDVPEAELADILRPFYRMSRTRERQAGGVGLGLAIAKRAVRSHGGSVAARNVPRGGLIVEVRLPRETAAAD